MGAERRVAEGCGGCGVCVLKCVFHSMLDLVVLVTDCVLIHINLFYNAFQLWRRWVVREYSDACGVAAELLAAFKLPCRKDAG